MKGENVKKNWTLQTNLKVSYFRDIYSRKRETLRKKGNSGGQKRKSTFFLKKIILFISHAKETEADGGRKKNSKNAN